MPNSSSMDSNIAKLKLIMLYKIFHISNKIKYYWTTNVFSILLLFLFSIKIFGSSIEINKELKSIEYKIKSDYRSILERSEKKAVGIVSLLEKTTNKIEKDFLLKGYNLLKHNDYLYLSFMTTTEPATHAWVPALDSLAEIEIYKIIYCVKNQDNLLVRIDVNALMQKLIKDNISKLYKISFVPLEKNSLHSNTNVLSTIYFDSYQLNCEPEVKKNFKHIIFNMLSPILMLAGWFVIYFGINIRFRKLYKNKYNHLINDLNRTVWQLKEQANKQAAKVDSLKLETDALRKTNRAIDCFAKDFIYSLVKNSRNQNYKEHQGMKQSSVVEFFPVTTFVDKPISYIIEEAIQYHADVFLNNNHEIVTSGSSNVIVPSTNIFGIKKVLIVSLQYLLTSSPANTKFKFIVDGNTFLDLKIGIEEHDTFCFIDDKKHNNNQQPTQKFTDLFCLSWEELIELSKNEDIFLDKKYEKKNRYIFITILQNLNISNKKAQKNVHQIYQ